MNKKNEWMTKKQQLRLADKKRDANENNEIPL